MLMTVKSLSFVARITGNWKSLLVAKGVAFHDTLLIFCRVQTDSEEVNFSFRGVYPAAALERSRTYVYILYRQGDDLSREMWEIVGNG